METYYLNKQKVEKAFTNLKQFIRMAYAGSKGAFEIEEQIELEEKELGI